jgi:hypothetical protein
MTIKYVGAQYLTCLSTDTKPTTVETNFIAYETDRNLKWLFNGTSWVICDPFLQMTKKFGSFPMEKAAAGGGDGLLRATQTTAATTTGMDTTLKRSYLRATTTATNGNNAGWIFLANYADRDMNPKIYVEFRINQTGGSQRLFLGFQSNTTAAGGSDDPLNALEGFYFGFISTDSVYKIIHNDSSGVTVFDSVTAVTTIDTAMHKLWIIGDATNNRFGISIDGNAYQYVTTEIPAATTALAPHIEMETTTGIKSFDIFNLVGLTDS